MKKKNVKSAVDKQKISGLFAAVVVIALIVLMFCGRAGALISAFAFAAIIVYANCS